MKNKFLLFSSLCLLLAACENMGNRSDNTGRTTREGTTPQAFPPPTAPGPTGDQMDMNQTDNTGR